MVVKLISSNQLMEIVQFIWDDFPTNEQFCDRIKCSWRINDKLKEEIYKWEDVEISEN